MRNELIGGSFFPDPGDETERLQALRAQRVLVDVLLEAIASTRRRLDIEPGAGTAWQSPAQKQYMLRRLDLRSECGRVEWLVEEARSSLNGAITAAARG